jgi:DnaJ like chaperone protein
MSFWGKIVGGVAGFAMGGPFGAVVGAALGHAADNGAVQMPIGPAKFAAMLGRRDQLFAISVVVLSAKLAKVDGPVNRLEIDAFKRHFRIPPEAVRDIGRLFDQARDSSEGFETYARQLGTAFADSQPMLEDVMLALFALARADGPVNAREAEFLRRVHDAMGLEVAAWARLRGGTPQNNRAEPDAYAALGLSRDASDSEIRATWKRLMREHHPDHLAARGADGDLLKRATDKVARINAAWDRIKRERRL